MLPNELIQIITPNLEKRASGIYMILCVPSNKAYIGQSKNIYRRWSAHKQQLKKNKHANSHLQNTYSKYGKDSLVYFVLENGSEQLTEREAYYVSQIDEDRRLNLRPISNIVPISEITRLRMSLAQKGKKKGRYSKEHRANISKAATGRRHTQETKMKLSKSHTGLKGSRKGVKLSIQTRFKMSLAQRGKVRSEETKKKISEALKKLKKTR